MVKGAPYGAGCYSGGAGDKVGPFLGEPLPEMTGFALWGTRPRGVAEWLQEDVVRTVHT